MKNNNCFICRKHKGYIPNSIMIFENDYFKVFHVSPENDSSVYLGYLFIESKRCIPDLSQLNDNESKNLGILLRNISNIFVTNFDAEKAYSFVLGDNVKHFHMHVVPRYNGTPEEYKGFNIDEWPDAPKGNIGTIEIFCKDFKKYL